MKTCSHCGRFVEDTDQFCSYCGVKISEVRKKCPNCGAKIRENDQFCMQCGYELPRQQDIHAHKYKQTAVILGILFGGIGVHNFYLGYSSKGLFQVLLFIGGLFTFGLTSIIAEIWGLSEAIMILFDKIDKDADDYPLY